jgi:hypothetical protein
VRALATADTLGKVEKPGIAGRSAIAGRPAAARRQKQQGWKNWEASKIREANKHVFTKFIKKIPRAKKFMKNELPSFSLNYFCFFDTR